MKNKLKIIIAWLLVIIWILLIFFLSSMDSNTSNIKSVETINKVVEKTNLVTNDLGITNNDVNKEQINDFSLKYNVFFRKCMHFFMYFILVNLILIALSVSNITKRKYIIGFLISFIYSIIDEYHQGFIGRNRSIIDIMIDLFGIIIGIIIYKIILNKRQNKTKTD